MVKPGVRTVKGHWRRVLFRGVGAAVEVCAFQTGTSGFDYLLLSLCTLYYANAALIRLQGDKPVDVGDMCFFRWVLF